MALGLFPRPFLVILTGSLSIGGDSGGNSRTVIGIGLLVTATYRVVDRKTGQIRIDFAFVDAVCRNLLLTAANPGQKNQD